MHHRVNKIKLEEDFCLEFFVLDDRLKGLGNLFSDENDQSYEDYVDEVEHLRSRNRERGDVDVNRILSHLGLPEYEYVDAENYDYLLPKHLTYGKEQTVKLHNAKTMSCEI